MRIDELHKFSDSTLNDVRTALDDRLKGIQMKYLPQTIWRQSDRDKAGAMIQAIDKQLKTRSIMRSLEKFIGQTFYKAVRHRYSNPMIQPELEGSTQGYPLDSVEVLSKNQRDPTPGIPLLVIGSPSYGPKHPSDITHSEDGNPALANIKQAHEIFNTSVGNPVNEILLKLNLPDHRILKVRGEGMVMSKIARNQSKTNTRTDE
ncbi:hypothetical protein Tco_0308503 [Tanacetum coccineum]